MATITRYVNPDSTAGGNGTTNATTGANRAYVSLSAWEAAQQQNLTDAGGDIAECICETGGSADTTAVSISGWTTGAGTYIDIKTSSGHRHAGVWDTAKYRLTQSGSYTIAFNMVESYIRVTGLQIQCTGTSDGYPPVRQDGGTGGTADVRFDSCIIRGGDTAEGNMYLCTSVASITNCILYGASGGPALRIVNEFTTPNVTITNCTMIGGTYGISNASGTVAARNVYAHGGTDAYTGTITKTTCAHSSASSFTGSTASIAHSTANFTNVTASSEDYHLVSGADATLKTGGTDYSGTFTLDIDGETRSDWGIGADELDVAGGTAYDRTFTETVATQNPYARTSNASRTYSESAGSQNPYARTSVGNRAYAETGGLSDSYRRIADGNRSYSDIGAGSDAFQRGHGLGRAFAESIASLDAYARVSDGKRNPSDTLALADAAQRTAVANRSASDAVGLSDAYTRTSAANRQHSDSIGLTDVYARLADALRNPTDSLAGSDAFSRTSAANRAYADNLAGVESFARLADAFRAFTDTLGLADEVDLSTVGAGVLTLAVAEVLGLTDAISRQSDSNRAQSDTFGALDAFARITVALRAAEDVVGIADAYARVATYSIAPSDSIAAIDAYARTADHSRAPSDSIGVDDEFARIADAVRSFTESLGLIDDPDLTLVLGGIAAAYYYRRYILARRF